MIITFKSSSTLKAYNGYDSGIPVNLKDGDTREVSDQFGGYLLKTFSGNVTKGKAEDLPENKAKVTAEAEEKKKKAEATKTAEDMAVKAQEIIETAKSALKEHKKNMDKDDIAEVNLLIDECNKLIKAKDADGIKAKADEIVTVAAELDNQYPGFNKFAPAENKAQTPGENK